MKPNTFLSIITTAYLLFLINFNAFSQVVNNPESVVFDSIRNRYICSNKNNNSLLTFDRTTGKTEFFVNGGLLGPGGLVIKGDTLMSVSETFIKGYQLSSGLEIFTWNIAEGKKLNDISFDSKGYVYVSDGNTDRVYRIESSTGKYSAWVTQGIDLNGIMVDEKNNRLLLCGWGKPAKIQAVDLTTAKVSTVLITQTENIDGMALDNCGNYYISSYSLGKVYAYDSTFSNPHTIIIENLGGPADIYINQRDQILCIPELNGGKITFVELGKNCDHTMFNNLKNDTIIYQNKIDLNWSSANDAFSFELNWSTDSTFKNGVNKYTTQAKTYTINNLVTPSIYYLRIRPILGSSKPVFARAIAIKTQTGTFNELVETEKPTIYTNPTTHQLHINSTQNYSLQNITNNTGQKVIKGSPNRLNTIDVSTLKPGLYFANLISMQTKIHQTLRFIKN